MWLIDRAPEWLINRKQEIQLHLYSDSQRGSQHDM